MTTPIALGHRRELFVDRLLIAESRNIIHTLHAPERREVVWQYGMPWEASTCCYFHAFHDGDRVRLYHRGYSAADDDKNATANLLESSDGIHFTRPELGAVDFQGTRLNNVVFKGVQAHNLFVIRDDNPAAPPDQRYKAVGAEWQKLYGLASPDGVHWRLLQSQPLAIKGEFDSLNVIFWDSVRERYRLFSRHWDAQSKTRAIQSCESVDFIHWTDPAPHRYYAGIPMEHFYTNATTSCPGAEHLLLSFPKRFNDARILQTEGMIYPGKGVSDAAFMSSRDGVNWDRSFLEAWLRPGADPRNWTHRSNMVATGIIRTAPDEWSMYVSEHYGWPTSRLRRLAVRPWGFASLRAYASIGEATTPVVTLGPGELRLNYSTSASGSVRVELQNPDGGTVPGYALSDMDDIYGDQTDGVVRWRTKATVGELAGRPLRMRFELRDADLFAFRVAPL